MSPLTPLRNPLTQDRFFQEVIA
ncbi:hypothetical protein BB396_06780 [Helicobacter pylori]|uniref:Uncharacterized protein n=1 Tax=Helicobacter pylori TaxID=210 RepID=A0AAE5P081_HELPX|nr:hypothetical protein BB396_06780 [Helicobacter pylori]PDW51893.1 hypothetical protein BB435_06205 [Helicobacter pylori]PDW57473.1 hypothetical protein BB440_06830 [Helicobacter pylori]PDX09370.1 hypothetical protein BB406_06495 [Helicobacter pylori]PDX22317.1 hypothetical protein BB416_06245 [Helicobacter pylori]